MGSKFLAASFYFLPVVNPIISIYFF